MPGTRCYWIVFGCAAVLLAIAVSRIASLRVDSNLTAFLPRAHTPEQALLLNELNAGPGSRVWLLALTAATTQDVVGAGRKLADELTSTGLFANVYSGGAAIGDELRELLFRYRYLLDPHGEGVRFTAAELRRAFETALEQLHSPASPFQERLISDDPTGAMTRVVDSLRPPSAEIRRRDGVWLSPDEKWAFVLAESKADGVDLYAQERVAEAIREIGAALRSGGAALRVSGAPAFAVAAKARIQREAMVLSMVSTALLVGILYTVYRSISLVLLISLPILGGILGAVAITSAIWGSIHGISLAFGTILLGVALDYPIHLIGHARSGESLARSGPRVWPTLRLGCATTVLGFAAMLTAGFPGIEQLAVFAITGLICAALLTRHLLASPYVLAGPRSTDPAWLAAGIAKFGVLACLLAAAVVLASVGRAWLDPGAIFASDIDDLSPVPESLLAQDRDIREMMGAAEAGHFLLVRGADTESVLREQEAIQPILRYAVDSGYLESFDMAASVLPSQARQRARQAALPERDALAAQVAEAIADSPFRDGVFQAFVDDVAAARQLPLLDGAAFDGTMLETRVNGLIRRGHEGVTGLVTLTGLANPAEFAALVEGAARDNVVYIAVNAATNELVNAYRDSILLRSAAALVLIALFIAIVIRDGRRLLRIMIPVLGATLTAAAVPMLLGHALSLFHLVSLLLVVGIGLDYALFLSRPALTVAELAATRHSVFVCALSTVAVFAVLSFSSIPVLSFIGGTVAIGAAAAFFLSARISPAPDHEDRHA